MTNLAEVRNAVRSHRQESEERDLDVTITAAFEGYPEERTVADCPGREAHVCLLRLTFRELDNLMLTPGELAMIPRLKAAVEKFIERAE